MTPPNLSILMIMICFWLTLWLVKRYLITPILGVLNERSSRIETAIVGWQQQQEALRLAGERLEKELGEAARGAAARRLERRQEATQLREQRLAGAQERAGERLTAAIEGLAKDAEKARAELKSRAEGLAVELAGRLLGRELSR